MLGEENNDTRLTRKELVIGLDHGQQRIAYAFKDLSDHPVVNDSYEGAPVVITYDPDGGAAAAFNRVVDGQDLTFETVGRLTMRDAETGTTWASLTGVATAGALDGSKLEQLPSFVSFWFSWTDFHPSTDLWAP